MFVIMLDYLKRLHPDDWPISGKNKDIETLRLQTQDNGIPQILSKQSIGMTYKEEKSLVNSQTGVVREGGIYEARDLPVKP